MNLFDSLENINKQVPLAELLRPKSLDEYLGQNRVISENSPLYRLLHSNRLFSFIFWGPPGCGKTTLARLIAEKTDSYFLEISAVTSGIKEIKDAVETAKEQLRLGHKTLLFIDEIHRYNKTQQDALLPHLESGLLYLIGSTTENPSFQVIPALLSRVQVIQLRELDDEAMYKVIERGFKHLSAQYGAINVNRDVIEKIASFARGDARVALNTVEACYFASELKDNIRTLKIPMIEELVQKKIIKYSEQEHYDCASAFQKSLRGSDKNAAIYYLAKMLAGGEDPRFIARRLMVCAAEDVSNADPQALQLAIAAFRAVEHLGMPEARIPLAQAAAYVADAPKSNKTCIAIDSALADIQNGLDFQPPAHLKDAHYKDAAKYGFGKGYIYTHDNPDTYQQFMPDELIDRNYFE